MYLNLVVCFTSKKLRDLTFGSVSAHLGTTHTADTKHAARLDTHQEHDRHTGATCSEHPMEDLPCLSNDSSSVAAMRATDDEETSVDLLQTAGNFVYLFDCSHEYYASSPMWWSGLKNSPTVTHACRKRRLKWVPSAWGYSWVILSPGVINTATLSSRLGVGRWTNNPTL
jgi:hypothetical protein